MRYRILANSMLAWTWQAKLKLPPPGTAAAAVFVINRLKQGKKGAAFTGTKNVAVVGHNTRCKLPHGGGSSGGGIVIGCKAIIVARFALVTEKVIRACHHII